MGVQTAHLLTPMDQPLGHTVGNALEVAEAVGTLQGRGPRDLVELTLDLASRVSSVSRDQLRVWLSDGTAWKKFVALVEAQGGDALTLERILVVHRAPIIRDLASPVAGRMTRMDAGAMGRAGVALGAGRTKASDRIDFAVGFSAIRKVGDSIGKGEPLLLIHARDESTLNAARSLLDGAVSVT